MDILSMFFTNDVDYQKACNSMSRCKLNYNNLIHQFVFVMNYYGLDPQSNLNLLENIYDS